MRFVLILLLPIGKVRLINLHFDLLGAQTEVQTEFHYQLDNLNFLIVEIIIIIFVKNYFHCYSYKKLHKHYYIN